MTIAKKGLEHSAEERKKCFNGRLLHEHRVDWPGAPRAATLLVWEPGGATGQSVASFLPCVSREDL